MGVIGIGKQQEGSLPGEKIAQVVMYKTLSQTIQDPREAYGLANHLARKHGGWKAALRTIEQRGSQSLMGVDSNA